MVLVDLAGFLPQRWLRLHNWRFHENKVCFCIRIVHGRCDGTYCCVHPRSHLKTLLKIPFRS